MGESKRWRLAMIGGGEGSLIGDVHRRAAIFDGGAEWQAGCFSRTADRNRSSAAAYGVDPRRAYDSIEQLLLAEFRSQESRTIDAVVVTTPNDSHLELAELALAAKVPVLCEKPLARNLQEASALQQAAQVAKVPFVVMHNYSGYPMVRQARAMCTDNILGKLQAVRVQYIQGWLRSRLELTGNRQASWRTDPRHTGISGCFADIGSHAFHLACYITQLEPRAVSAQLRTFTEGRQVDDYGQAWVRCSDEALLSVTASQVSHGYANGLRIDVDGTEGSISWAQEDPCRLHWRRNGRAEQVLLADVGNADLHSWTRNSCRLPAGHPEGFLEAFANIYQGFFDQLAAHYGQPTPRSHVQAPVPSVADGWRTMQFIDAAVRSSNNNGEWMAL